MSNQMNDDRLNQLKTSRTPAPREAARRRAVDAALLAFDAGQEKAPAAPQGNPIIDRLTSILASHKGKWTMDTRLTYGLGTAALALFLLPLGYQLYSSTAITPVGVPPVAVTTSAGDAASVAVDTAAAARKATPEALPVEESMVAAESEAMANAVPAPMMRTLSAPSGGAQPQMSAGVSPKMTMESFAPMPEPALAAPTDASRNVFTRFTENPVKIVKDAPVSTFSIDVDTASYAYVRKSLASGRLPEPDAVRIEEMINYFDYDYPMPDDLATPFRPSVSVYPTPWNARTQIVQIGIKGYVPDATGKKPSNLVFLIDTSGSMDEPDKLPLLKRALRLLVDRMGPEDTISVVAYAGSAGVVLAPTRGTDKSRILDALDNLGAGGSTAGAEGIELAYRLAEQNRVSDGISRVILATDGDFNVGIEDPEALKTFIRGKRDGGVFLSVLGFGQGNLGDDTMQALAQNGNGNASYIDSFKEAQKVLVADAGGTLDTIARDVKIQVEFNPAVVSEYRLIGYETRALNREDFNNDQVDAGEIGAGTTVTALYEITPAGSGGELNDPLRYEQAVETPVPTVAAGEIGYLKLRYKLPGGDTSRLTELAIGADLGVDDLAQASADSRFAAAVAAFGQKLKGSNYGDMGWDEIRALAQAARGADESGYRAEFMQLIDMARALKP